MRRGGGGCGVSGAARASVPCLSISPLMQLLSTLPVLHRAAVQQIGRPAHSPEDRPQEGSTLGATAYVFNDESGLLYGEWDYEAWRVQHLEVST